MKLKLLIQMMTGLAVTLGTTSILVQPSLAEGTKYVCGTRNNVPITYARTERGNIPLIRWVFALSPNWTPQRRCQEVSRRFQINNDNGSLQFIKSGVLGGKTVICSVSNKNDACTEKTLLFTLQRGSNAQLTVKRLMDRRGLAAGNIINENACKDDCPVVVDVNEYLNNTAVDENTARPTQPSNSTPAENTPWWYKQ